LQSVLFLDKIEHIFFDLDHTLWDFDSNSRETLSELYDRFLISELTKVDPRQFVMIYQKHNERCWDLYRKNRLSKSRLRSLRFEQTFAEIGIPNRKLARTFGDAYIEICPQKSKLNEGAIECLDYLVKRKQLHILSNGFQEIQLMKLSASGIQGYFNQVITSELARSKKPDKKIFDFALKCTGAKPEEALLIGDNFEVDIVGGTGAGWSTIHYDQKAPSSSIGVIRDLRELLDVFSS